MPVQNIWWWYEEFSWPSDGFASSSFEAQIPAQTVYAVPAVQRIKCLPALYEVVHGQNVTVPTDFEVNAYVVSYTTADGVSHPAHGPGIFDNNVNSVTFGWWVKFVNANAAAAAMTFQIFGWG